MCALLSWRRKRRRRRKLQYGKPNMHSCFVFLPLSLPLSLPSYRASYPPSLFVLMLHSLFFYINLTSQYRRELKCIINGEDGDTVLLEGACVPNFGNFNLLLHLICLITSVVFMSTKSYSYYYSTPLFILIALFLIIYFFIHDEYNHLLCVVS